jgi:hypothetical protein
VESLQQGRQGKKSGLNLAANSKQNVCSDFQPNSLPTKESTPPECAKSQDIDLENSGPSVSTNNSNPSVSSDNLAPLQISTTGHIRRLPESLMEFERFCGKNNISTQEGLSKLYFTEKQTFLSILKSLIVCAQNKKSRNRLEKFEFLLKKQNLYLGKVHYYTRLMQRVLLNHKEKVHTKTIKIRSLMDDGEQKTSDLPEIYLYFSKPNVTELQIALADTGGHKLLSLGTHSC